MANTDNLIPMQFRSPEEQHAIRSAGGKASMEARRKVKAMREAAQILLSSPLVEEKDAKMADLLRQLGLEPDQQSAILVRLIQQAKEGDIRSAQFVRDLTGQMEKGKAAVTGDEVDLRSLSLEELERMLGEGEY
ncbi:MAG: hypothetical protein IKU27_02155 [Clostridia bacterium]|nr:hypothetical protein [Clostridia bacterium]